MIGALTALITSRRRDIGIVCNERSHSYEDQSGDGRSVEAMLRWREMEMLLCRWR
jgi:hypothetical protein